MSELTRLEKRAALEWSRLAGEAVDVEQLGGALYAFGSELAVLRLFRKFHVKGHTGFSANLGRWYFSLELEVSP